MNISSYTSYFHDGSIIDVQHHENEIWISIESAEMCKEDLEEDLALSEHHTLMGILHLEGIEALFIDGAHFHGKIQMMADSGGIIRLKIDENKIQLFVEWVNFPPKKEEIEKYSDIRIECKKIYWENIPHLYDPFR